MDERGDHGEGGAGDAVQGQRARGSLDADDEALTHILRERRAPVVRPGPRDVHRLRAPFHAGHGGMAALRPALLPRRTSAFLGGLPRGLHRDGKRVPHARRQEGEPRASPRGPGLDNAVRGSYIPGRGMRIGKDGGVHAARAPRVRQLGVPLLQGHAHAPHPRELQVLQRRRDADRRPDARADHALRADLRHQPGGQPLGRHGAAVLRGDADPLRHHPRLVRHSRALHEDHRWAEEAFDSCE
mmetsp:Transcript_27957/g.87096  ORF Transcript_27957/g.87096 Transcript_27957/m.87096 type:complete len:242 (-) Transcript_27957:279-1004(-)